MGIAAADAADAVAAVATEAPLLIFKFRPPDRPTDRANDRPSLFDDSMYLSFNPYTQTVPSFTAHHQSGGWS